MKKSLPQREAFHKRVSAAQREGRREQTCAVSYPCGGVGCHLLVCCINAVQEDVHCMCCVVVPACNGTRLVLADRALRHHRVYLCIAGCAEKNCVVGLQNDFENATGGIAGVVRDLQQNSRLLNIGMEHQRDPTSSMRPQVRAQHDRCVGVLLQSHAFVTLKQQRSRARATQGDARHIEIAGAATRIRGVES